MGRLPLKARVAAVAVAVVVPALAIQSVLAGPPVAPVGPDYFGNRVQFNATTSGLTSPRTENPMIADMNKDGKNDIVTFDHGGNLSQIRMALRYGNGDGTFASPITPLTNLTWYKDAILPDVNGDGYPDVVMHTDPSGLNQSTTIEVRLGGASGFSSPQSVNIPVDVYFVGATSLYSSDMTGDGRPELIMAGQGLNFIGHIVVLENNGSGSFTAKTPIALWNSGKIGTAADYTGDGILDVITQNGTSGQGQIWKGNADATFSSTTSLVPLAGGAWPVTSGDFNGDGKADVLWHSTDTQSSSFAPLGLRVFFNQGGGAFQSGDFFTNQGYPYTAYSSPITVPSYLNTADINNDGKLDLLAGFNGVYINDGTGHLSGVQLLNAVSSFDIALGDLNGDNYPDLVSGDNGSQGTTQPKVNVWFNLKPGADEIAPVVMGTPDRQPAANGWYDDDVTISWSATDPQPSSGMPTQPPATIASQEGIHTYTSAPSCDPANNCATGNVTVKIDKSAPTINYLLSSQPNNNGWHNESVLVTFFCNDSGGVQSCTEPVLVDQEGQTSVTGTVIDKSGKSTSITVPVRLDTTRPTITFTAVTDSGGWTNNSTSVAYQCVNEDGSTTDYQAPIVNGPNGQLVATGSCTDQAGNTTTTTIPVYVDQTEPDLDYEVQQPPTGGNLGWSRGPVTVNFHCDDPAGSGGTAGSSGIEYCTDSVTVSAEGTTVVTGTARDRAGNTTTIHVTVNIDSVEPTLTYSLNPNAPSGVNGWYTGDVTINFVCSDTTSGVAGCPQPLTVSTDTQNAVQVEATDVAGNVKSLSIPIMRDATKPTIDYTVSPALNADGWSNTALTVTFVCADVLSGVASCTEPQTVTLDGAYILTGTAVDQAGNSESINVIVGVDSSAPTIIAQFTPSAPNINGWFRNDVQVSFICDDNVSTIAECSDPTTLTQEGTAIPYSGSATDLAGNTVSTSGVVKIDKTAPSAGIEQWSLLNGVKPLNSTISLVVPFNENQSMVQAAEYFIGDVDPGRGNGATMAVSGNTATSVFGTDFPVGTYRISVRSIDYAGNWSDTATVTLVVTNPNAPNVSGNTKNNDFVPLLANGDVLPGLVAGSTNDASAGYTVMNGMNGLVSATSSFKFMYNSGPQCNGSEHSPKCNIFKVESEQFQWYVTYGPSNNVAEFQGIGTMNIAGTINTVLFRVTAIDGGGNNTDTLTVKIFQPNADTNTATPLYKASASGLFKNSVKFN